MKPRVFIVDDNSTNLYMLKSLLEEEGFDVITAENGKEALEKAHTDPPDLIVSDILMPVMDGFTLCRQWKADDTLKHIPLVFYTAEYTGLMNEDFALSLGADRFILKPQEPDILMNMFKGVLEEKYTARQVATKPLGEEMEFFRQYNEVLFKKLEKKMLDLEIVNQELKILEGKNRESEELFRSYLEYAPDGVYISDLEGNFLYGNRKCEEIIGYRREELIGKNFLELNLLPENGLAKAVQLLQANREGRSTGPDEIDLISKAGRLVPVEINTNVVQRMGQRIVLSFVRDITRRRQAEETLRESEEKYRGILEDMDDAYYELDLSGNLVFFNAALISKTGYSRGELMGMNYRHYISPETYKPVSRVFSEMYRTGQPVRLFDYEVIMKSGQTRNYESWANLLFDHHKQPIGFRGIARDITARKQAEANLKKTLESLRKAFGTTVQVMVSAVEIRDPYTAGHQNRVADLARAIATEMGFTQDRIDGLRMAGAIHDIGKLSVPAEILTKPRRLTDIEYSLIREHAKKGYEILRDVESPWPLAQIVYQHHERMNGSGYPGNLKGEEILMEARILAVADVVESMANHRPYRPSLGIRAALDEIAKNRGVLYDTEVVDVCLKLFNEKGYQMVA